MPGKAEPALPGTILAPDVLLRLFYAHPLDAFPVLDDALSFAGLLERRYVEAAARGFSSARTTVKQLIDRYISKPVPGDIVKRIYGKSRIQPMPVIRIDGSLLGIWELSAFFRVFDSLPLAAHLDFQLLFDNLSLPVLVTDSGNRVMSFNRSFSRFSGIQQDDRRVYRRKRGLVFRDLGWAVTGEILHTGDAEYGLIENRVEGGPEPLTMTVVLLRSTVVQEDLNSALADFERQYIAQALHETGGNISATSQKLGIPRQTLQYKLSRLGIGAG